MSSDRLYLDDTCPTLLQLLRRVLVEDPGSELDEQDFMDFEVGFSLSSQQPLVKLKVTYPFLMQALQNGSQDLLERIWEGLPLRIVPTNQSEMYIELDTSKLVPGEAGEALAKRCVEMLSKTRTWLLIGPLIGCLKWLRDSVIVAADAAMTAAPGNAAATRVAAVGKPPSPISVQLRQLEQCWIIPKVDRTLVIFSVQV